MNVAIDKVLDKVAEFSLPDKEIIMDILGKRLIDEKRDLIAMDYEKAMNDYRAGRVKTGTVNQLFMVQNSVRLRKLKSYRTYAKLSV